MCDCKVETRFYFLPWVLLVYLGCLGYIYRIKDKEAGKHVSPKTKETKPDAEDDMYDADTDVDEEPRKISNIFT